MMKNIILVFSVALLSCCSEKAGSLYTKISKTSSRTICFFDIDGEEVEGEIFKSGTTFGFKSNALKKSILFDFSGEVQLEEDAQIGTNIIIDREGYQYSVLIDKNNKIIAIEEIPFNMSSRRAIWIEYDDGYKSGRWFYENVKKPRKVQTPDLIVDFNIK